MTTNTPSANFQYARFKNRLIAFGFDYLLILGYLAILTVITNGFIWGLNLSQQAFIWLGNPFIYDLIVFFILVLPVILSFTLQESSSRQATWGKRKAGLQVININGERLTKKHAFIRSFLKFLPWQIAHTSIFHIEGFPFEPANPSPLVTAGIILVWVMVGVYIGSILISKNHRTPYDLASGAYVIIHERRRIPPDD